MADSTNIAMPALCSSVPTGRVFGFASPLYTYSGIFMLPGFGYPDYVYING